MEGPLPDRRTPISLFLPRSIPVGPGQRKIGYGHVRKYEWLTAMNVIRLNGWHVPAQTLNMNGVSAIKVGKCRHILLNYIYLFAPQTPKANLADFY